MSNSKDDEKQQYVVALRAAHTILAAATIGIFIIASVGTLESAVGVIIGAGIVATAFATVLIVHSALNPDSAISINPSRSRR